MNDLKEIYKEINEGLKNSEVVCIETYSEIINKHNKLLERVYSKEELEKIEKSRINKREIKDRLKEALKTNNEMREEVSKLEELILLEEELKNKNFEISFPRKIFNNTLSIIGLYAPLIIKAFYDNTYELTKKGLNRLFKVRGKFEDKTKNRFIDSFSSMVSYFSSFGSVLVLSYIGAKILRTNNWASGFYLNLSLISFSSGLFLYSAYINNLKKSYDEIKELLVE